MKKFIILLILIIATGTWYYIYDRITHTNVVIKFEDLEPLEKKLPVYLKGFKIGKTTKIYPSKDFKNTYVNIRLKSKRFNLPNNITAKIVKGKIGGYINILYPDSPSITKLKENDEIVGKRTKDFNNLINERFVDEELEGVVENATSLIENANIAVQNLGGIFNQISEIIKESRPQINKTMNNLATTTTNLKEMSNKLNNGISQENISNSIENIEEITNQINNETIPTVNNILCEANEATRNAKEITRGIKKTLKERMGLAKFLFGRPVKD